MRRSVLTLTAALLLLAFVPVRGQEVLYVLFRDYMESLRTQAGIPGMAAAIVGRNDVLWEQAFGQSDLERSIAARTDTPFHLAGLTQLFTATLVLRCIEEGRLSLDDQVGQFTNDDPEPERTIGQLLTHTSGTSENLLFAYRPERLEPLRNAVGVCRGNSYRESLADLLQQLTMIDSVPGPDVLQVLPPASGISDPVRTERYAHALDRLAVPYEVDQRQRASRSQYSATGLSPAGGLISSVRDFVQFDLALKNGVLLKPETLAGAWQAPLGPNGQLLPYATGWFAQIYNGEPIVWQFGVENNASSSLVVSVPRLGLTLVMLATSDRLVRPFALASGDLAASPFARLFLGLFVR